MALCYLFLVIAVQTFLCQLNYIEASSCSAHTDCPIDQCCGQPRYDILDIVKSCQPYAKVGQTCHGSLLTASCDCEAGLVCQEHSGVFQFMHFGKGVCVRANATEASTGLLGTLYG